MNKINKKTICFIAVFLLFLSMAKAENVLTTKIEGEISGLSGISELDNSDGTSVNVTIHNSTGIVVSRNAAAGVYLANMTIVMTGAKFNLSYSADYIYNLSTIYGDFTYNFTTPSHPGLGALALHTGQTQCYNSTNHAVECSITYEGQDGQKDGTSKSYTNSSCGTGTVGDDHTGLCWQWDDYDTPLNWTDALDYCNELSLGGHTDWRLPSAAEIITMMDYSCNSSDPAHCYSDFQNTAFEWTTTTGSYWSSTTRPEYTGTAYYAYMYTGDIGNVGKTFARYVRCVRSE